MTNQLAEPGIGHNLPPTLADELQIEISPHRERATELIEAARGAVIIDDVSAGKVIDLAGLLQALEKDLDASREARGRPFLEAQRAVNGAYNPVINALKDARDTLRGMLNTFRRKRDAEAEAARQAAFAEQRRREAEAAAAAERARKTTNVRDQLASLKAQEDAAAAARRAEAIRPEPVRAQLGSLGAQRKIEFEITDLRKLLGWMIKQPIRGNVEQSVRTIMGAYLRQLGVDAVARGVEIPGLAARVETQAAIRR